MIVDYAHVRHDNTVVPFKFKIHVLYTSYSPFKYIEIDNTAFIFF